MYPLTLTAVLLGIGSVLLIADPATNEKKEEPTPVNALDFTVKDIDGKEVHLGAEYSGKVVLIVNVASQCGFTRQYADLQALHEKYEKQGLVILGFPCNQFGKQEPGTEVQIKEFCESKFHVQFDLFSKIDVIGDKAAPLYKYLVQHAEDAGPVKWNFEKFLVSRDGKTVQRFRTKTEIQQMVETIEKRLEEKAPAKPAQPAEPVTP